MNAVQRARSLPPKVVDVALATTAVLVDLFVFSADLNPGPAIAGYSALGGVALLWRRRAPLLVFSFVWLHTVVGLLCIPAYAPVAGLVLGLYTVAAYRPRGPAQIALAFSLAANAVDAGQQSLFGPHRGVANLLAFLVFYGLLTVPAWGTGRWVREHRDRLEAHQAVAAERARIARELHDIVAHSVTVMMLQAAVAKRLVTADPAEAAQSLADIDQQGKQAMSELRRMLAVLRPHGGAPGDGFGGDRQHGLADIDHLVRGVNRAGVSVELEVSGDPPRLDPSVDLTAYRVVQEALTNTTKHAGPGSRAVVQWTWTGTGELTVQVRDSGNGRPDSTIRALSTGHGLLGLRERVEVVGGRLEAGPTPDGGFQVVAVLPVAQNGPAPAPKRALAPVRPC